MSKVYSINRTKFLSDEELSQFRATLERNRETDPRNVALLLFLLTTGARVTEALNVTIYDLFKEDHVVLIKGIKGSNDRELPIDPKLFNKMMELASGTISALGRPISETARHPKSKIFGISYTRAVQIWQLYRPAHKKLHSLRHTFAVELFKKTKDIKHVQMLMGHRNLNNTLVYAQYVYSISESKKLLLENT
jgi:site-specific recombinase XerD